MRSSLLVFFCLAALFPLRAQIGGEHVYSFLNLSPSARITGLGGHLISVRDGDVSLAYGNPALLNPEMHQAISFNHNFHLAGIQNGFAAYGHHLEKAALTLYGGIQYLSYGTFDATNEFGDLSGEFRASEYAITLGAGRQLYERLAVGANLKLITSRLESYNSLGLAADLAAAYSDTARNLTLGLVIRNIGAQLSSYTPGNREQIPFDIQIGLSHRLRYLPFRLSITYHHLHRWNITYDDPDSEEDILFAGIEASSESRFNLFADNLFRHFVFSGEFLFGKKEPLRLRFGYNHLLRKELSVNNFRSLAGFSFGVGLKLNRFRVEYGRGIYHLAGGLNHFTLSTNLSEFSHRKMLD